jgi:hypothetical protein
MSTESVVTQPHATPASCGAARVSRICPIHLVRRVGHVGVRGELENHPLFVAVGCRLGLGAGNRHGAPLPPVEDENLGVEVLGDEGEFEHGVLVQGRGEVVSPKDVARLSTNLK